MQTFWMGLLLIGSLQDSDSAKAEKLFQAMANKLTGAKTLQCSFAIAIETSDGKAKVTGKLAFAEGNKNRLEADGDFFGNKVQVAMISDGMKTQWTMAAGGQPPQSSTGDVPPNLNEFLREGMARSGVFIGLFPKSTKKAQPQPCGDCLEQNKKADEVFQISGFKLDGKEILDKRETRKIEFHLTIDKQDPIAVTVWLDAESTLPLKRQLTMGKGKMQFQMVETYMNCRVNEVIEAKEFAVPK
jgi:outer membrane lipoprotein-sorting protein